MFRLRLLRWKDAGQQGCLSATIPIRTSALYAMRTTSLLRCYMSLLFGKCRRALGSVQGLCLSILINLVLKRSYTPTYEVPTPPVK